MEFISRSEEETLKIASEVAEKIDKGWLVLLSGELGAGKTRFAKGMAKALKIA